MNEPLVSLSRILTSTILPNLKSAQTSQAKQIAPNDRLENAIEEMRLDIESQFASLSAQLTACRAELAATQAIFHATQVQRGLLAPDLMTLIH
jgi:dynactin complex subunit